MKILFVTNGYPTKKHPEYCVFTKEQIESVQKYGKFESEIFFINAKENGALEYIRCIPKLLRKISDYDIIHTFHGLSFLLVYLLTRRKKIIVSFLNSIENEFGDERFSTMLLSSITKFLIRNTRVTKIFKDKVPPKYAANSYYLPNGVDTKRFYPINQIQAKKELNLSESKKYILFVSSKNKYRKQKRYDRYTEVIKLLKKKFPEVEELTLVNEPREKIVYYFNAAELHLLTSDYEGSPNSVKEAVACNIPVVATNVGNVEELLSNVDHCYISYNFTIAELVDSCMVVLTSNISKNNINRAIRMKRLDIESKANELISIYEKVFYSLNKN